MKKFLVLTSMLIVMVASCSFAFDGNRKGFVMGIGPSICPVMSRSVDNEFDYRGYTFGDETNPGYGINLMIGYAIDNYNTISLGGTGYMGESNDLGDNEVFQGFFGFTWSHYFGEKGNSFLTTIGIGDYAFDVDERDEFDARFGYMAGVGYEFTPHVQISLQYASGTTDYRGLDVNHYDFSANVTFIAY